MTPDQAHRLQDLFMEARHTTRQAMERPGPVAEAADDDAVKAFFAAVAEFTQ